MRFNQEQGQGQISNRFGQNQNRFNKGRGQAQNFQNFGQKRGGQSGQNGFNRNGGNNREVFCTFCKKYRHQVANCIALKNELRRRGYKIANTTNGFEMDSMVDRDKEIDLVEVDQMVEVEEMEIDLETEQVFSTE